MMNACVFALISASTANGCLIDLEKTVFADMHDGDEKEVTIENGAMTIKPANSEAVWVVNTQIDCKTNQAVVDFNVPGKDDHPPVPLIATLYASLSEKQSKTTIVFTDSSGQIVDDPSLPLNQWVSETSVHNAHRFSCPDSLLVVFQDMHDGDEKAVKIDGTAVTITPNGSDQRWTVKATLDQESCTALVDFDVPGKDDHPPVPLLATYWSESAAPGDHRVAFEFTDPSGTLADPAKALNRWIALSSDAAHV